LVHCLGLLAALAGDWSRAAVPPERHAFNGGAWFSLELPHASDPARVGFTLLSPATTGVAFTNSLDETAAAANRVLLNGAGVAVGDYDNDGWPDLFFSSLNGRNTLYRNLGGWKFEDVTLRAGLTRDARFYRGAVFADLNGDGQLDLLLGVVGGGVECFLNNGNGTFRDESAKAGTKSPFAPSTLALADVDGNGTLDLYVANNRAQDIRDRGQVDLQLVNGQAAVPPALQDRLVVTNGQILEYGEPDQLYLNDGRGRFRPVAWTSGRFRDEDGQPLLRPPLDWGLCATFRDVNGDGWPDLYVCNDFWTPDRLWLNDGKGRFQAAPRLALRHMSSSSMGVDFADIDRDGRLDFFVVDMLSRDRRSRQRQKPAQSVPQPVIGAIDNRPEVMRNTLFVSQGDGTWIDTAWFSGVAASDWSWSPVFLDVDLDGYEDLLITAGHAKDVQDLDAGRQIASRQHSWKGFGSEAERQTAFTRELAEHMRLYPRLEQPIVAFHNLGGWRFEEVTTRWGTDSLGIHHALALGDFDRDGDLDLVVNNLDGPAGLYRNEASAARVAVRLRGLPPNVQGIGARVWLRGGAVPSQSQEIIAGGRYMAGAEPLLVFAAGFPTNTNALVLEVAWRSGRRTQIDAVQPNRLYEIEEPGAAPVPPTASPSPSGSGAAAATWFTDASALLQHTHHEEPYDDYARQPLLPRRLSQLGPGVCWFDIDGDGLDDLIIGAGRGGETACYRNERTRFALIKPGPFQQPTLDDQTTVLGWRWRGQAMLLAGLASYETGRERPFELARFDGKSFLHLAGSNAASSSVALSNSSVGPLAFADVDGDGELELFVGGRVVPGRYPEAASSRLLHFEPSGQFRERAADASLFKGVGLVSGAIWSDLNGDGFPELVLACEWGPIRVFQNERGQLREATRAWGLEHFTGWWSGVGAGDFDGDGRLDLVGANWGLNSEYSASAERPCVTYYGDLLERGTVDLLEAEWEPVERVLAPRQRLDVLARSLPQLQEKFLTFREFSTAPMTKLLAPFGDKARRVEAVTLATTLFLNRGDHFDAVPLPREAQLAPAFAVTIADFDGDGQEDLFLSQNCFDLPAPMPRLDGGRGLLLQGNGHGELRPLPAATSGIYVHGEQRGAAVADFDADGRVDLVVTQNGGPTRLWKNQSAKPGRRLRLEGPAGNPSGVGAVVRVKDGGRLGPAHEVHAGSGYWSQDSTVLVLAGTGKGAELWVRWPGGLETTVPWPAGSADIVLRAPSPGAVSR
jgi:hypothetical protein